MSVEFVIVFPAVFMFFLLGAELGLLQLRQSMMEHGLEIAVRQLRLGDESVQTADGLKSAICDNTVLLPHCKDNISVDMVKIDERRWDFAEDQVQCVDNTSRINPVLRPGAENEIMLLRFCVIFRPIFPWLGIGREVANRPDGTYPLFASTAFVNEP